MDRQAIALPSPHTRCTRRVFLRRIGLAAVAMVPPFRASGSPLRIDLLGDRHVPPELSVPAGTTVAWINHGADWLGIAALDGSFASGRIAPGEVFTHRFARRGNFMYVCQNHAIRNMTGRIAVT